MPEEDGKGFLESGLGTLGSQPPPLSPGKGTTAIQKCRKKGCTSVENYALSAAFPSSLSDSNPVRAVLQRFVSCSELQTRLFNLAQ